MRQPWFCAALICAVSSAGIGWCQEADATEFADVGEARAFGWKATPDTILSVTDECQVGSVALRAQPEEGADSYRGIDLIHAFDLTGAGPADSIVFHVKQNFGSGMRIQLWTDEGPFNRSFPATHDGWARIELDLDIGNWEHPQNAAWDTINRVSFYEKQFMQPDQYMILDGLAVTVGGRSVLGRLPAHEIGSWSFPHQSDFAWYLGNERTAWAISKTTGQVLGGWNAVTRERYLNYQEGRYHLEDRESLVTGRESEDQVLSADFSEQDQRIELTCANATVPNLRIVKRYWLEDNRLSQRVVFASSRPELEFITYNCQVAFAPTYRDGGYYMGGGDGGGPLVPAPQISTWQKVVQYQNTAKGMLLHQPEKGYSFAHIRTRLDDQFVWPWFTGAIASYVEPMNMMSYTPDGWDMSLGTSRLAGDERASYTQYLSIAEGDWQRFLTDEYASLPEVQEALAEIPPAPEWVGDIKVATGADMVRLRRIVEMTDEGTIMVLFSLSGSWADYYVDRGIQGGYGGWITGPELRDHIQRIKALSPRIKVGIYQWVLSTTDVTRIYRAHPEWFRYGNKDGEPLTTFPGMWPNFAQLLSVEECYQEILSQFDLVLDYLDTDFIYLDDPKAINMIDWETGEYTRDDLSFRFFLDLKRIAAEHGPDKMIFFNNRGNPYGDINYIEARSQLRANYWRHFAGIGAVTEQFVAATRPRARIIPLYYTPPMRREYMNLVLAQGWVPDLTYCDVVASRAFFQAAYEVGNCSPAPVAYSPDWKREKTTNVESYTVRRAGDDGYLMSFISHAESDEKVPVAVDLDSMDLDRGGRVFVWEYVVANALEYEGCATEEFTRQAYTETGWQLDRVTDRRLVYSGPYRKELALELDLAPLSLHQLYVTDEPAAVYSEDGLPGNYLVAHMPQVTLSGTCDWQNGSLEVAIDTTREECELVLFVPLADQRVEAIRLDGQPVEPHWVCEGDAVLPLVKVGKGEHTLEVSLGPAPDVMRVPAPGVTQGPTGIEVELPDCERAVLSAEGDGRARFGRMVSRNADVLALPLPPAWPEAGPCTVSLRAIAGADGQLRPVAEVRGEVELAATLPDLALPPERAVLAPGTSETTPVNRTINGVEVLNAATMTTAVVPGETQPGLASLIAEAAPDELTLRAGATRAIIQGQRDLIGGAFAGFEVADLRQVRVRLANTFHDAYHLRGPTHHVPDRPNSRNFAGIVVDYHTAQGYTKRLRLATGVLHRECSSRLPDFGQGGVADETRDLGTELITVPEATFALDLEPYAPQGWDGRVWLSVGTDWVCASRTLELQILATNENVTGEFLAGTDPSAFREAYARPRVLEVRRSPGGIIIDGPAFEEWWGGAAETDEFFLYGGEGVSKAATSAKLMYDDDNLYVAFICHEPERRKPLIVGGPPWNDDEVEVWLDVNGDQKTFRQVIINAANDRLEYGEAGPTPIGATSAVQVREGDSWMVEMTIPFEGLGVNMPAPGDQWRLSLCRGRPPGRANPNFELIVWAPLQSGGFNDLANFGTMIFR